MEQEKQSKNAPSVSEEKLTKKCTKCEQTKNKDEFYIRGGKCKECVKAIQRDLNKKNKENNEKIKSDPKLKNEPKTCRKCGKEKTVGDFRKNRRECLDCEREFGRKYNKEHSDVREKWKSENKEHVVELEAKWYQKNKPQIREKYRKRYAEDELFKIQRILKRELLYRINKVTKSDDYIGTSFERIVDWLEYNFTDEMNWDNHGTCWDIDHVIPINKWDLNKPDQFEMCFNWKNLSPLECQDNRCKKRQKIVKEQVKRHLAQLEKYFEEK